MSGVYHFNRWLPLSVPSSCLYALVSQSKIFYFISTFYVFFDERFSNLTLFLASVVYHFVFLSCLLIFWFPYIVVAVSWSVYFNSFHLSSSAQFSSSSFSLGNPSSTDKWHLTLVCFLFNLLILNLPYFLPVMFCCLGLLPLAYVLGWLLFLVWYLLLYPMYKLPTRQCFLHFLFGKYSVSRSYI